MATAIISAIALDLGTTSIKAAALNRHGELCHLTTLPAPAMHTHDGTFESDALAYAEAAEQALAACVEKIGRAAASALPLGLCSQRSSFLLWQRASGIPVTPLISWQDKRGAASCAELHDSDRLIQQLTGLRLTPYYLAPKLRVLLQQHPAWRAKFACGEWLAGTLDTFLIWRWTHGQQHMSDASMAARTLLMDISLQQWSPQLCALFGIASTMLPGIRPSAGLNLALDNGLTLQASLGDQSAALYASVAPGNTEALVNLGTGGFVIRYLGASAKVEHSGYLHTLVYQGADRRTHLAIEGTLNSIAAALAAYPAAECGIEELASNDIHCLAEPSGLGAPYFRNDLGLRFSGSVEKLTPREIAALLLEGIIFRVARILEEFDAMSGLEKIYLSGGLSELSSLQQGIAHCAPCPTYRLLQHDSSLHGAAMLAAGLPAASHRQAEKIHITAAGKLLQAKYQRWKIWLDSLLAA
jgi:glycerol kinase